MYPVNCTLYCTVLYNVPCTLYTVLYTEHCIVYSVVVGGFVINLVVAAGDIEET